MSAILPAIKDGAYLLIANGCADASRTVEPEELWPHAVVYDHDDGATILKGFQRLCDAGEGEGDPLAVSCCAQCGKKTEEMNDGEFKKGMFLSLETYGGANGFLTDLESLGYYTCPKCCQLHSTGLIKTLLGKLLGDLEGLRYLRID